MPSELEPIDRFERMNDVVGAHLKGGNPSQIATALNMKRAEVVEYIEEWKTIAQNSKTIQGRANEALVGMDEHFGMILGELWDAAEQADMNDDYKAKAAIVKSISDVEAKRVDTLQKAGLINNDQIGNEVVEMERKHEILIGILREVTSECSHCKVEVARRLSRVTGDVESMSV